MVRAVDGAGFAFTPRSLVAQPRAFGTVPGLLEPADDVGVTIERYRAAMLQHVMAVAAKAELLKSEGIAPAAFVARFEGRGLGEDRVRRIFRGETMAQLADLMFWSAQLPAVATAISEFIRAHGDGSGPVGDPWAPITADAPAAEGPTLSNPEPAQDSDPEEPLWLRRARHNALVREIQASAGMGSKPRPPLR